MANDYRQYFRDKKITVMGLGLLGRGLGDAKFLAQQGAILTVTDLKTPEQLSASVKELDKFTKTHNLKSITYVLGRHRLEDFKKCDLVIKAAGVPLNSPFIAEAIKCDIPVKMSTALFAEFASNLGVKIVGVTGTRGKSTVTHLIYHIAREYFGQSRVVLGGNVRGMSTLALLKKVKPQQIAVLELDSWQLQGFGDSKISPHFSVFTNFLPDHLNYYLGDPPDYQLAMGRYFVDKANIFKFQEKGDVLVLGPQFKAKNFKFGNIEAEGRTFIANPREVVNWKSNLPGRHNLDNIACAAIITRELGVPERMIKRSIASFAGVPGRLELVKNRGGVKFYNDTNSTTPDALKVGIEALGGKGKKNVVLIMGGADKKLDFTKAILTIKKYCKAVILLPGSGTDRLIPKTYNLKPILVKSLKEALVQAEKLTRNGDTVLFSPGFASFGLFKNEYDRGDQFNRLVRKLSR